MSNVKVSVIIPVYNVSKYLKPCLDSIINQTLKEIEIICVDDGSTDNSLEILNEYKEKDSRFIVLTQQNKYAGIARNTGLEKATGKYVCFLDSDDFFELSMLEQMYNKIEKDNSDVVVCGYYNYDNQNNKVLNTYLVREPFIKQSPFSPQQIKPHIFNFCRPNPWTKLFKRELFLKYNIKFDGTICSNDLSAVYTALIVAERISTLDKPLIYYRSNQDHNLTAKRKANMTGFKSDLDAFESLYANLKRLNKYEEFKVPYIARAFKTFQKTMTLEHKKVAKSILSPRPYNAIFNKKV